MLSAYLLRLGTDSRVWGSGDITFEGNSPARARHKAGEFFNGWWPLVELEDANHSIPGTYSTCMWP